MTIYVVVCEYPYDGCTVMGAYSSLSAAEDSILKMPSRIDRENACVYPLVVED